MIYTKEEFFMSYMSMIIYNIYSFVFIIVYIFCIIIYLLILYVSLLASACFGTFWSLLSTFYTACLAKDH